MLDWINSYPQDLISNWRVFRKELEGLELSELDTLKKVSEYWALVPRGPRSLDYYTPDTWPTPWEIIHHNLVCNNTVSLLIYYTLVLLPDFNTDTIQIVRINDGQDVYIAPLYKEDTILNLEYGELVKISECDYEIEIQEVFKNSELPKIS